MNLDEINTIISNTSRSLGYAPPPVTPESVQPDARRDTLQENRKNRDTAAAYMQDVSSYLGKVRAGRSIRAVNPNQPALSPRAEMLRQAQTVTKANRFEREAR